MATKQISQARFSRHLDIRMNSGILEVSIYQNRHLPKVLSQDVPEVRSRG